MRVSANGGTADLVIEAEEGERIYGPHLLPDGDSVLFSVTTAEGTTRWDEAQIVVQSLRSGERTVVLDGGSDAYYVRTGHLLYALADTLFAVAFDADRLEVKGGPVPLAPRLWRAGDPIFGTATANYGVSDQGTLVYIAGSPEALLRTLVWVDREGREEAVAAEASSYVYPRISPDGTRVVLADRNQDDLWVWDFVGETRTRLTVGGAGGGYPVWTADGERIAYHDLTGDIYWQPANNTGAPELLAEDPGQIGSNPSGYFPSPYFFSPTGTELVFRDQRNPGTGDDIAMVALEGGADPILLLNGSFTERNAELSPDGRWMAYESNESGRHEVYVRPFPNVNDDRVQVSNGGGIMPLWSRNGRELFYLERGASFPRLVSAFIETERADPVFAVGTRQTLFDWPYAFGNPPGRRYDVSLDGQQFLAIKGGADEGEALQINVVLNWVEELKARVPTDR